MGEGIWEKASGRMHLREASGRKHRGGLWDGLWDGSGRALGWALRGLAALEAPGVSGRIFFIKWHHSAAVRNSSFFCCCKTCF
mgnify:CR=1 FL=1|jgi:hypothetical protein